MMTIIVGVLIALFLFFTEAGKAILGCGVILAIVGFALAALGVL